MGVRRNLSRGATSNFSYPLYVADDAMQKRFSLSTSYVPAGWISILNLLSEMQWEVEIYVDKTIGQLTKVRTPCRLKTEQINFENSTKQI